MKAVTYIAIALLAAAGGYFAGRAGSHAAPAKTASAERKVRFYQSPMHPWIKSDRPGKCTICGMDLVPVYEGDAGLDTKEGMVTLGGATASIVGIQTSEVRQGPLMRSLRVTGMLDDDDTRHRIISAYSRSRIEKLFVNQVGQEFAAGQPLASVYSPELLQARQEFFALAHAGGSSPLLNAARERLLRLGLVESQIEALATAERVTRETEILAPMGGVVLERNAYEGNYVEAGGPILTIADLSKLWFIFDVYESDLPWVRVGQEVEISTPARPGETIRAPIVFIDPNLNQETRTARARVVVDNADRQLRHRQTASAVVRIESSNTLLAPRSAVLFTQGEPVVYVDRGGQAYEARQVKLGRAGDADYEVRSGLRPGDRVVTQGALLLDGQAQLAHAGATAAGESEMAAMNHSAATEKTSGSGPKASEAPADIEALKPLVAAAAHSAAALANDDVASYNASLPEVKSAFDRYARAVPDAANGPLAQMTAGLKESTDLKAARRAFEVFSTAVADLARDAHLHHGGFVKIYECPMAPVLGTGRWVQQSGELKNPFFGSAMPDCGSEVK